MYCLGKIGIVIYDNNMICDAINWQTLYTVCSNFRLIQNAFTSQPKHNVLL